MAIYLSTSQIKLLREFLGDCGITYVELTPKETSYLIDEEVEPEIDRIRVYLSNSIEKINDQNPNQRIPASTDTDEDLFSDVLHKFGINLIARNLNKTYPEVTQGQWISLLLKYIDHKDYNKRTMFKVAMQQLEEKLDATETPPPILEKFARFISSG